MRDSRFWRFFAVLAVASVFYVGHGLHVGGGDFASLDSTALAGGVWGPATTSDFFTASEDGRAVYQWRFLNNKVKFVDAYKAEPSN